MTNINPKFQNITLIAHRGASYYAPENTLAALQLAKDLGATWVEFDVQLTIDNVPIVFHDDDLTRIGKLWSNDAWQPITDTKNIFELPWNMLRKVNVGLWFEAINPIAAKSLELTKIGIATLEEYLQLAKTLDFSLNLELKVPHKLYDNAHHEDLKHYRANLLIHVLDVVERIQWPREKIICSSFDLTLVKMAADTKILHHTPAALYWKDWPKDLFQFVIETQCSSVNLQKEMLFENPDSQALAILSKHNVKLNIYTVNTAKEAELLMQIAKNHGCEVNGFFTDDLKAFY